MATAASTGARTAETQATSSTPPSLQALTADPILMQNLVAAMQQVAQLEQATQASQDESEMLAGAGMGTGPAADTSGFGISPGAVAAFGSGLSALGMATGNAPASAIGFGLSAIGNLGNAQSPSDALGVVGNIGSGMLGGPAGQAVYGAVTGNTQGAINSALAALSPTAGTVNSLSGFFGFGTLGSALGGSADAGTAEASIGADPGSLGMGVGSLGAGDLGLGLGLGMDAGSLGLGNDPGSLGIGADASAGSSGDVGGDGIY